MGQNAEGRGELYYLKKTLTFLSILPPTSTLLPTEQQPRNAALPNAAAFWAEGHLCCTNNRRKTRRSKNTLFFFLVPSFSSLTVYWVILPILPLMT